MTGWEIALADYQAGKGGYIVPDPNQVSSCQELLNIKGKLTSWRDDLKERIKGYDSGANLKAIAALINALTKRIAEYDTAIQACYVAPATGAGSTDVAEQHVDSESTAPVNDVNPNGPSAAQDKKSNTKYIVIGVVAAIVLVTTAIVIHKMKK